ncbi:MAG: hypothetical protein PVH91_11500 [Pseudomonadales bacterium]
MSTRATPLEQLLAGMLGEIGNFTLGLDPLSRARLSTLAGRSARFEITPPGGGPPRPLTLHVREDALVFRADADGESHVIVSGTLPDIVRALLDQPGGQSVRIDGDESVLAKLAALFGDLRPDPAAPLGNLIGRDLADGLVGLAEAGVAFLRSAAETVSSSARQEATAHFVGQKDFESILTRIEALRLRIDRLDARTARAESARPPAVDSGTVDPETADPGTTDPGR